jgi:hypothetical protein
MAKLSENVHIRLSASMYHNFSFVYQEPWLASVVSDAYSTKSSSNKVVTLIVML